MKYGFLIIIAFLCHFIVQAQEPEQGDILILPGTGIVATEGVEGAGYSASLYGSYFLWDRSSMGMRLSLLYNTRDIKNYNEEVLTDFNAAITYDYCFAWTDAFSMVDVLSAHVGAGLGFARVCSFSADTRNPDKLNETPEYKPMLSLYCFITFYYSNALGIAYNYIPSTAYHLSGNNYRMHHSYFEITYSIALWGS